MRAFIGKIRIQFKQQLSGYKTFTLLAFIAFFSSFSLSANEIAITKFKQLTTEHGLSQSYIFSIAQDDAGFIWIATADGLNRYDGYQFVQYRHNIDNPNSIADNYIRKVFKAKDGTLWIGTQNGLSRYNQELDNFTNYYSNESADSLFDNTIWDIYQDNQNTLWVSTAKGLQHFNESDQTFDRFLLSGYQKSFTEIKTIYQDSNNSYWLGTFSNGIFILPADLSKAVHLLNNQHTSGKYPLSINANALYDIKEVDNKFWLATDNGVYAVNKDYQITQHYSDKNHPKVFESNQIRTIEKVNEKNLWFGSKQGVIALDTITGDINKIATEQFQNGSPSNDWLLTSFKDNNNNIWLGTYGNSLFVFSPKSLLFEQGLQDLDPNDKFIYSIVETSDNEFWFTNDQGHLIKYELNQPSRKIELNHHIDIAINSNSGNSLWLLTSSNKLLEYDIVTSDLTTHNKWDTRKPSEVIQRIIAIDDIICFINVTHQLECYNPITESFTVYNLESNQNISALRKADDNNLLLVTLNNDVYKFSIPEKFFELIFHNEGGINSAFIANNISYSKNWFWLGSESQGIVGLNKNNYNIKIFNEYNGLPNNYIGDIVLDNEDNVWFSTNKGISVINSKSLKIRNFDKSFGINLGEFNWNSALKSSENQIYFGNPLGFYKFNPQEVLKTHQNLSSINLLTASIANTKLEVTLPSYKNHQITGLNKQINFLEELVLQHNQFPLTLEFISPNSNLPQQVGYRYRLMGLEENWIKADNDNRRATYTNLSFGDYQFEVEAYDLFNPNLIERKTLDIQILPPWWLNRAALLIYALILFLICVYFLQQYRNKLQYHNQIRESEERLKLSLWGSGDEMWDWNINTGKIFRSNIWGILEFPQDGTRNVGAKQTNIHPHDIDRVKTALNQHFDKKTEHFEVTYRVKNKNEQWVWVLDRGKVVERDSTDNPVRMTGTLKDISHIKKAEERLKLFAKCVENISDAVIIYDRQFVIVDVNKAFIRITGKQKSEMLGQALNFTRYPESFSQNIKKHLLTHGSWHGEVESRRKNGETYYTDLNIDVIRDESNNISHFVGVFSDITARKKSEVELRRLANSDTLTGLPNRSYFQANQQQLVNNKTPHALLVFDLDNFKKINDSMGHQVGDILLVEVAKRIVEVGSSRDSVYRLGGDEFSIIIEDTNDIHTITTLAKKILKAIAQPLKLKSQEVVLYSSIGIVLYPEDGASPQELLKNADTAMYHAKGLGGNKYQFFSDSMNKQAVKRLQIESLIRHGLKEDLFSVFYQPKIEIRTGKVAGMEALVRFDTPNKGVISPLVFIPVSEETGQIIDIGEIVLRKACFATKKWVDAGLFDGRIAVNLSAVQFTQPNLVKVISSILEESRLPAKYLELEITEGTVMDSPQQAIDTMLQIRAMGIHLSLDDFGTGYSSLAYLKKFPLNTLKIDKAFVDDIEVSEQGRNMVATIVTIAHNLGMHVVAEGVETNNQLNFLSGLGCEQLQGYLYSKPLAEAAFQKYLLSHQITDQSTHLLANKK